MEDDRLERLITAVEKLARAQERANQIEAQKRQRKAKTKAKRTARAAASAKDVEVSHIADALAAKALRRAGIGR